MPEFFDAFTFLGALGFQEATTDLLAVLKDEPRESIPSAVITNSSFTEEDIISVSEFSLELDEKSAAGQRYAGEGLDPNTFHIQPAIVHATINMPLIAPVLGWVDPPIGLLWHHCRLAPYGSPLAAMGNLTTQSGSSSFFIVDNVADFASVIGVNWGGPTITVTPQSATAHVIGPTGTVYPTAVVTSVDKAAKKLMLSSSYSHTYPAGSFVAIRPDSEGDFYHPAFTLVSLKEGLLSPCFVNKFTITAKAGSPIQLSVEVKALRMNRAEQLHIHTAREFLMLKFSRRSPSRIVESAAAKLFIESPVAGSFALSGPLGDPLFAGFQGLDIPNIMVSGFTLTVDNSLKEVHSLHSLSGLARENAFPYAVYSEGRKVSGTVNYKAPIEPFAVAEKLSGHSAVNGGGMKLKLGPCSLKFPQVAWTPSTSHEEAEEPHERTLAWTMLAEGFEALPQLEMEADI